MLHQLIKAALAHDQSHGLQLLAVASVDQTDATQFDLMLSLADVPDLHPQVRTALAAHPAEVVRDRFWQRGDAVAAEIVSRLGHERQANVLEHMFKHANVDELAKALTGRRMNKPFANALVRAARWDLPEDIFEAALVKQGTTNGWIDLRALAQERYDLTCLAEHPDVDPVRRLTALASQGTPTQAAEKHFTDILTAVFHTQWNTEWAREEAIAQLMKMSGRAAHSPSLREQLHAALPRMPELLDVATAWEVELEELQTREPEVVFSAETIGSPEDLWELWLSLDTAEQRRAFAQHIWDNKHCSLRLFNAVAKATDAESRPTLNFNGQRFWLQQEDLFKTACQKNWPAVLTVLKSPAQDWAAPKAQLCSWMTDVLLEKPHDNPRAMTTLLVAWRQLLLIPDYPRDRVRDLPCVVITDICEKMPGDLPWVAEQVSIDLAALASADAVAAAAVLAAALTPEVPFSGMTQAAAVALRH